MKLNILLRSLWGRRGVPKIRGTLVLAMWIFRGRRCRLFCDLLTRVPIHMFVIVHLKIFAARYVRYVKSCICRCSMCVMYDILIECSCHVCSATKDFQDSAGSRMLCKTGLHRHIMPKRARLSLYPRAPAPPFLDTSAHVLRKPLAIALATLCAFGERNNTRKRCL